MEFKKQRLERYTTLIELKGRENKTERMREYNNILFNFIEELEVGQQLIVINEVYSGGIIYGTAEYGEEALKKLRKTLKNFNIEVIKVTETTKYKKIAFSINRKSKNWRIL